MPNPAQRSPAGSCEAFCFCKACSIADPAKDRDVADVQARPEECSIADPAEDWEIVAVHVVPEEYVLPRENSETWPRKAVRAVRAREPEKHELLREDTSESCDVETCEHWCRETEVVERERRQWKWDAIMMEDARLEREVRERHDASRKRMADRHKLEEWLLRRGFAGPNSRKATAFFVRYPLHAALHERDSELVNLLLAAGADPGEVNYGRVTPFTARFGSFACWLPPREASTAGSRTCHDGYTIVDRARLALRALASVLRICAGERPKASPCTRAQLGSAADSRCPSPVEPTTTLSF